MTFGLTSGASAMTPLPQPMSEDMQLRGLASAKVQAYLRYLEQLALFTGKSPDLLTDEDFRHFFLAFHKQRGCSRSSATLAIAVNVPVRSHPPAPLAAPRAVSSASHPNLTALPQPRRGLAHSLSARPADLLHLPDDHLHLRPAHQPRHQASAQLDRHCPHAAAATRW
jgi:hypothetical protein